MLLDGERVDRPDLCEHPARTAKLGVQLLVPERVDLVGRDLDLGDGKPVERELPLPTEGSQRLVSA